MKKLVTLALAAFLSFAAGAQQTERFYLTGTGLGNTLLWKFYCTDGMNSNVWSSIEVPSQWELEGFGEYSYGRWYIDRTIEHPPMEKGLYKRYFEVPADWKGRRVRIVFEGVMTDMEVIVNGKRAGDIHQGGFNEFSYDITDKLIYEERNLIEVNVSKESSNASVNAAERKADWWIFGGIYRPVYLEAKPAIHIRRIAVDARADGTMYMDVYTTPLRKGYTLDMSLMPANETDNTVFNTIKGSMDPGVEKDSFMLKWDGVKTWDVENPYLYYLTLDLKDSKGTTVHTHRERIGFRTVELCPRDGLYVNGTKVVLKGINRHSFHPDGGRTTNAEISLEDGRLIKQMNMNAVRFHYAPDKHFLDVCDSLGIFVIDELAGWQNCYDTEVGSKLIREFIERDVNRPSIIIWSNGNEGGWNYELDHLFAELDPQKRHVIHPWADWGDLDTHHYPAYQTGVARFNNGYKLFMPTEFMHGMYDQGHGAGLEDFWNKYTSHPLFVGGFMWDFSDNVVRRTDKGGKLDSDGSNGTDGILGPYREKEGSYYTVREVWAPIQFENIFITPSFDGRFLVKNTYLFSTFEGCRMEYRLRTAPSPLSELPPRQIARGEVILPAIGPGETGTARMKVPANLLDGDYLEIVAWDKHGNEICTWTWPVHYADDYTSRELAGIPARGRAEFREDHRYITLACEDVSVSFDKSDGLIRQVNNGSGEVSLVNGPVPVGMNARFTEYKTYMDGDDAVFTAYYLGAVDSIRWTMKPSGLISMQAVMLNKANGGEGFDDAVAKYNILNFGFTFSYPEEKVDRLTWFGRGPYRVWKNRIKGTNYGVWEKYYNNTMTGADFENLVYPEFKGYHGNTYWAMFRTSESPFTVYSETDGVFLRVFTPEEPADNIASKAYPEFPEGDISFLLDIPAIRCFKPTSEQGPQSQPGNIRIKVGDEGIKMNLWFDFRDAETQYNI